ncbi:GDSL esterase/lipase [Dendrobium catenatum]|uniref:GDSL esterase/lipase n=1 Tax=Dendrobium catenatum TaxID=906689 RepID=A0A2I0VBS4_9ASPA|nr:GDSL esterase/lipase [Dendrobium catenatum]
MAFFSFPFFLLLLLPFCSPDSSPDGGGQGRKELVPAMFIFGDSLIDNANLLGLPLIPAHSETSTAYELLHGVNYASAAAGILDITGQNFMARIPFNEQIKNFESTLNQITGNLSADTVARSIGDSIFFIGMGSNDYLNNYLMPNYNTRIQYNPNQFSDLLIQHYSHQLTSLYNLGARKFVLSGVGSLGCIPSILAQNMLTQCSQEIDQSLVHPFNSKMKLMVDRFNQNLTAAKFTYIDTYHIFMEIINNPGTYGFNVTDSGCCGVGRNNGQFTCLPYETPCSNREQYVFWDAFHPTAKVNVLMAKKAFAGGGDVAHPINIEQLAKLKLIQFNNSYSYIEQERGD